MNFNFSNVEHLNHLFNVKPAETILDGKNNLFHKINEICKDILSSPDQISFIFQRKCLRDNQRFDKLNIHRDVVVLYVLIGDELKQLGRKLQTSLNRIDEYIDDDGNIDWMQRKCCLDKLGNEQKIHILLKENKIGNYDVLVDLQEPIQMALNIFCKQFSISYRYKHFGSSYKYSKLKRHGMLLDPNKTFQDYNFKNDDEITLEDCGVASHVEIFEIWVTSLNKTLDLFKFSENLEIFILNKNIYDDPIQKIRDKAELIAGDDSINIYFDVSHRAFREMGLTRYGDNYRDDMNNIDWIKREKHLDELPEEKKIKVGIRDCKTFKFYFLLVDPLEGMDVAMQYHQNKIRISRFFKDFQCFLIKGIIKLDLNKTFKECGINDADVITVDRKRFRSKEYNSSSDMVIPINDNYKRFLVPSHFNFDEVMDMLSQKLGILPGSFSLFMDKNQNHFIPNNMEYSNLKEWNLFPKFRNKVYLGLSSSKDHLKEISVLGEGAFGSVCLFEEMNYNRKYACKKIKNSSSHSMKSFERETRAFKELGFHPGIVRYFCFIKVDNVLSIFMEHMPGGSLRSYLDKNGKSPMEELKIISYAKQILKALQFLHNNQVIHRDVRAANVLLGLHGKAKLADLGLSIVLDNISMDKSETGTITRTYGNYRWMAPEMMLGEKYGSKVDIWSFGATMVEMLTGRIPYPKISDFHVSNVILKDKIIKFDYPDESSDKMKSFTSSCLHATVSERPIANQLLSHDLFSSISFRVLSWN